MRVLVTGGAGYIGSVTSRLLLKQGYEVVVFDNLSTGFIGAIPKDAIFVRGDLLDQSLLTTTLKNHRIDAVIHFASKLIVPESVLLPAEYYENNVVGSMNLIQSCRQAGVDQLIFSSTAAVYGSPAKSPVSESCPPNPINPYGRSKLMVEQILQDMHETSMRSVILRYFNVAGATADLQWGQRTRNATHLMKIAAEVACHRRPSLSVYGNNYPTPDGTGVRDYIHVEDLANAHVLALQYLKNGGQSEIFNCGYGHGYSVMEVVQAMSEASGQDIPTEVSPRRPGDSASVVADSSKIRRVLGWSPEKDDLHLICRTTYEFERSLWPERSESPKFHLSELISNDSQVRPDRLPPQKSEMG